MYATLFLSLACEMLIVMSRPQLVAKRISVLLCAQFLFSHSVI